MKDIFLINISKRSVETFYLLIFFNVYLGRFGSFEIALLRGIRFRFLSRVISFRCGRNLSGAFLILLSGRSAPRTTFSNRILSSLSRWLLSVSLDDFV